MSGSTKRDKGHGDGKGRGKGGDRDSTGKHGMMPPKFRTTSPEGRAVVEERPLSRLPRTSSSVPTQYSGGQPYNASSSSSSSSSSSNLAPNGPQTAAFSSPVHRKYIGQDPETGAGTVWIKTTYQLPNSSQQSTSSQQSGSSQQSSSNKRIFTSVYDTSKSTVDTKGYTAQDKPRETLRIGTVIEVLVVPPPPASGRSDVTYATAIPTAFRQQRSNTRMRRFVVIEHVSTTRVGSTGFIALPISTYFLNGQPQGVAAPRVIKGHHTIIFTGNEPRPTPNEAPRRQYSGGSERPMFPDAIRVRQEDPNTALDRMSRLNYGHIHSFDLNVKLKIFGHIVQTTEEPHIDFLRRQFQLVWPNGYTTRDILQRHFPNGTESSLAANTQPAMSQFAIIAQPNEQPPTAFTQGSQRTGSLSQGSTNIPGVPTSSVSQAGNISPAYTQSGTPVMRTIQQSAQPPSSLARTTRTSNTTQNQTASAPAGSSAQILSDRRRHPQSSTASSRRHNSQNEVFTHAQLEDYIRRLRLYASNFNVDPPNPNLETVQELLNSSEARQNFLNQLQEQCREGNDSEEDDSEESD